VIQRRLRVHERVRAEAVVNVEHVDDAAVHGVPLLGTSLPAGCTNTAAEGRNAL
jgi:hypothetical protein